MTHKTCPEPPDWFDIHHYKETYEKLSEIELYLDVVARKKLFDHLTYNDASPIRHPYYEVWEQVLQRKLARDGLNILKIEYDFEPQNIEPEESNFFTHRFDLNMKLPSMPSVQPLSIQSLLTLHRSAIVELNKGEPISYNDGLLELDKGKYLLADIDLLKFSLDDDVIRLEIDLSSSDNNIILQLTKLLPLLRARKSIPHAKNNYSLSGGKKVITLRVIPYLDLVFWSLQSQQNITAKTLSEWIFPDWPERDEKFVRDTLKPYAMKCLEESFLAAWKFSIYHKA